MTERLPRRPGYIENAARAFESAFVRGGDPRDELNAKIIRTMLEDRGSDIYTIRSPRQALGELEASESLSERLNAVLSCFNISPKTATFLRIRDTESILELGRWFYATYVAKDEPRFIGNHAKTYCSAFMKFGMVEAVPGDEDKVRLTSLGREVGQPVAAKMLSYEREEQKSLYPVFGQTSVSDEESQRAPLTRTKILLELMQKSQDPIDFAAIHQNSQVIVDSLYHLQRAGMVNISYEMTIRAGISRQYRILEVADRGKVGETQRKRKSFAEMVATACETLSRSGKRITAAAIFPLIPEEYRNIHSKTSIATAIHHLLKAFATDIHFLEDTTKNHTQEVMESAELTSGGKSLVTELLLPLVDALQGGNVLSEWRQELTPQVQVNLTAVAQETFESYVPYSLGVRIRNHEVTKDDLVEYVKELSPLVVNEEGAPDFRAEDLSRLVGLSRASLSQLLIELVSEGKLERELMRGNYYIYKLPSTPI